MDEPIEEYSEDAEIDNEIENEFGMEDSMAAQGIDDSDSYADSTPQFSQKDDLFSLFWKVVKIKDSSKVGYLDKTELGQLDISVRDCQRIAEIARTLNKTGFAKFFDKQAEIILATSSSKDGFLPNLFVSQKKFSTKAKADNSANFHKGEVQKKKGLFGRR
jgi:hypothetical protein